MVQEIFGVEDIMLIRLARTKIISEYIRNQLEDDYSADQMSIKEYTDPFTGSKNK